MSGFNGTVTLSATSSPVNRHGPTPSVPSTVGPYSTSTLAVATAHNTPQATYTITVKATSGSLVHAFTVTVGYDHDKRSTVRISEKLRKSLDRYAGKPLGFREVC